MTEKINEPSIDEWRRLYQAATAFYKLAPWKWMQDDQIFGVKNPQSGEIGYCAVLGNIKEVFALLVYEGAEGYAGHLRMQSGEVYAGHHHLTDFQKAMMASFENRGDLQREDKAVIKAIGLEFKGRKAFPQFRYFQPGFFPWYLTASQAFFLTIALEQALDVLPRVQKNPALFPPEEENCHLVRVAAMGKDGWDWHDEILPAPAITEKDYSRLSVDEVGIERIRQKKPIGKKIWEIGYFYMPAPVREKKGDKPYYPRAMMIVEQKSGMILNMQLEGLNDHPQAFRQHFMNFLETAAQLPASIWVDHKEAAAIILPIAERLKISLRQVEELLYFDEAYQALTGDFLSH